MATYKASVEDAIVVDIDGKPLSSLPRHLRAAARNRVKKEREKSIWTDQLVDPTEQRHLAHRVSNSHHRGKPTRRSVKKRRIDESRS